MIASGPTAIPYQRHLARSFTSHILSLHEYFTIHLLFCCLPCGNAAGHSVPNVSTLHSFRSLRPLCLEHNLFLHISLLYVALPCHSTHFSSAILKSMRTADNFWLAWRKKSASLICVPAGILLSACISMKLVPKIKLIFNEKGLICRCTVNANWFHMENCTGHTEYWIEGSSLKSLIV